MNKIVLDHYPVERLPEDIRREVGNAVSVRVTVEEDRLRPMAPRDLAAQLRREKAEPGFKPVTLEEAVARIRTLRDEWED